MNDELRYIFKGVLYACVLLGVIYAGYYIISYEKNKNNAVKTQPPIITYDDLLNTSEVSEGKELFDKNCSACHKLHQTDEAWSGINIQNANDKKELYAWIRNSDSVLKSGNKYYNSMFIENGKVQMTSFPNLTDKEIDEIVDYIKVEQAF